jgi:iron(III) transport system ATP-binding protein
MASVTLSDLTKEFPGAKPVTDVSLVIRDGELIALLGPSGCGKTTTLRMIAGFIPPTRGEIRVGDRVVSGKDGVVPPEHRRMSMIFQSYAVWPHMTVFENVAFGLKMRKLSASDVKQRVDRMLDIVHLKALAARYPSELSGGQQQRVALARALANEPETLLLDEPLSNLDANLREEMRFEIRRLHDEFGITSIYVTHDQGEAMVTADRVVVMNAGRIEQVGTPEDIYDRPATRFVASFIGMNNLLDCHLASGKAIIADTPLAVEGMTQTSNNGSLVLAIRPHEIEFYSQSAKPSDTSNVLPGTVTRQSFLGDARDYLVDLINGQTVRVSARPAMRASVGESVWLRLPPAYCKLLE